MSAIKLELIDQVHVLTMLNGDDDNRFTTDIVNEFIEAIDQVLAYEGNTALMLTCEHAYLESVFVQIRFTQRAHHRLH